MIKLNISKKTIFVIIAGFLFMFPSVIHSESVFLKNGSITEGVISGGDDSKITIKTLSGENNDIERNDILRILVHTRYKNKIYLTQTNSVTIEGFIVHQDNLNIILRTSLNSPEEIIIPREKVETISIKRPSERTLSPSIYSSVFLKNGEIIDCRIVRETVRIIDTKPVNAADRRIILKSDILRIQYNNSYKDKKVLRKLDGTKIEGYIMEEDSVSYIFRRELYSPVEEKIFKSDLRSIGKK